MKVGDEVVVVETQHLPPFAYSRHVGRHARVVEIRPKEWGSRHGGAVILAFENGDECALFPHQVHEIDVVTKLARLR